MKLKIYLSLILFTLFWCSVELQASSVELKPEVNRITSYQLLEDPDGAYTLNDLLATENAGFKEGGSFNEDVLRYWLKFEVNNTSDNTDWLFEFPGWLFVDAFILDENLTLTHQKRTGHWVPYLKRDYPLLNKNLISLQLPLNSTFTIYAKLEAGLDDIVIPENIVITATPQNMVISDHYEESMILALFAGVLIALFCYNFFVYLSVKDKETLFYLGILFISILSIPFNFGYFTVIFKNFESYPFWAGKIDNVLSSIYGIVIILFTVEFLKTRSHFPKLYKTLMGIVFLLIIIPVPSFFGLTFISYNLSSLTGLITFAIILTVSIKSKLKKIPSSSYFLLAFSFFIAGIVIFLLKELTILPANPITVYSMKMGISLKAIFFSFALANKINLLKKENMLKQEQIIQQLEINQELQTKVNRELEQKVAERTIEIKEKNEELTQLAEEIAAQRDAIEEQKEKAEKLLLNILPLEISKELEEKGVATPRIYDMATVVFTDFKDFTAIAEKKDHISLLNELSYCFIAFDRIVTKFGLEKIKTIGDSYMFAGGIPTPNPAHALNSVKAAVEIITFLNTWNEEKITKGEHCWEVRIGIHSGPLTAGVVGETKFAYDIWGDTVNIASRMESSGANGKINISGATYELIKDEFECSYRGKVQAKNKGELDMYFVEGAKNLVPVQV